MDIHKTIVAYHGALTDAPHHRYRSWEYCYQFFQRTKLGDIITMRDEAALQLGFYLASWGMYRGSSFLLQHAYSVHLNVVDCLASPSLQKLWKNDVGSQKCHTYHAPAIIAAVKAVKEAYSLFHQPTDTLVTKVLLGTIGCLPACDRFFIDGFKRSGFKYSALNAQFVERILKFCSDNEDALRSEQVRIQAISGVKYPFMKLVDMYFWQIGYEASQSERI